jgi:hypothetical protein
LDRAYLTQMVRDFHPFSNIKDQSSKFKEQWPKFKEQSSKSKEGFIYKLVIVISFLECFHWP